MNLPPLVVEALSDRGLKHFTNEDAFTFQLPSAQHLHALFVIADGVSSLGKSDIASQLAVDITRETYFNAPDSIDLAERVNEAIQAASAALREQATHENLDRMGTTIAGIVLTPTGEGVAFNVGDSRVYQIRNQQIKQLSQDQVSIPQNATLLGVESRRRSTKLSAFVGQSRPLEPIIVPFQARVGDIYLLCTDGLWSLITDQELYETASGLPIAQANRKFIDTAKERGAPDNVTIMTVRVGLPAAPRRTGLIITGVVVAILAIVLVLFGIKALGDRNQAAAIAAASTTSNTTSTLDLTNTAAPIAIPGGTVTMEVSATSEFAIPAATLTSPASATPLPPTVTPLPPSLTPLPATKTRLPSTATAKPTSVPPTLAPTLVSVAIIRSPTPTLAATVAVPTATVTLTLTATIRPATATNTVTVSPTDVTPVPTVTQAIPATTAAIPTTTFTPTKIVTVTTAPTSTVTITSTLTASVTSTLVAPFIPPSSVQIVPIPPTFTATPITRQGTVTSAGTRVRNGDSPDYPSVGMLNKGEVVTVFGVSSRNQVWYLIKTRSGIVGWVASYYIDMRKTGNSGLPLPFIDARATEMTFTPSPTLTYTFSPTPADTLASVDLSITSTP